MKQKLIELKGEIDNLTVIVRDFKITLWIMVRTNIRLLNKDLEDMNNTTNHLDSTDSTDFHRLYPIMGELFYPIMGEHIVPKIMWNILHNRPW